MSRPAARTWLPPRSQTAHQSCPTSAKLPHTVCLCPSAWRRPPEPPPRHFRSFSLLLPAFFLIGPRWLLSRLLPAGAWPLPARCRCFHRSLLPLFLQVSSCLSPCLLDFPHDPLLRPVRFQYLDEYRIDRLQVSWDSVRKIRLSLAVRR